MSPFEKYLLIGVIVAALALLIEVSRPKADTSKFFMGLAAFVTVLVWPAFLGYCGLAGYTAYKKAKADAIWRQQNVK